MLYKYIRKLVTILIFLFNFVNMNYITSDLWHKCCEPAFCLWETVGQSPPSGLQLTSQKNNRSYANVRDQEVLLQWFLSGAHTSPQMGTNKCAPQHKRFLIGGVFHPVYIFKVRGAWNTGKILQGGVVEKRLRTIDLPDKVGGVATSQLALCWMRGSPWTEWARRTTTNYMWREQAIIEWSCRVNSIVACCHSAKLCTYATRAFRSQQRPWWKKRCKWESWRNAQRRSGSCSLISCSGMWTETTRFGE